MKRILFFSIFILFVFSSCSQQEEDFKVYPAKEYIVASERGCFSDGNGLWATYFFVKEKGDNTWETYDRILGLNYEQGYEYQIKAEKIKDKSLLKLADGPNPIYLRLVRVMSLEKKNSEGLPDNYIKYSDELPPPSEYFPHE